MATLLVTFAEAKRIFFFQSHKWINPSCWTPILTRYCGQVGWNATWAIPYLCGCISALFDFVEDEVPPPIRAIGVDEATSQICISGWAPLYFNIITSVPLPFFGPYNTKEGVFTLPIATSVRSPLFVSSQMISIQLTFFAFVFDFAAAAADDEEWLWWCVMDNFAVEAEDDPVDVAAAAFVVVVSKK